jgi:hypothetical protein
LLAARRAALFPRIRLMAVDTLAPEERVAIARAYAEDARAEHASVAAFARFSLELLACGAPPDLVADAHRAALDEIDHARLGFAVATRIGGEPVGPGALAMDAAALAPRGLVDLVHATAREGCLGETLAAFEAAAARDACEDATLRDLWDAVARDEARHAALAWRFAAWAIDIEGEAARVAFESGLAAPEPSPPHVTAARGAASVANTRWGRLDEAARRAARARGRAWIREDEASLASRGDALVALFDAPARASG